MPGRSKRTAGQTDPAVRLALARAAHASAASVTVVTGTAPIVSSGGATPAISITPATDVAAGSMSAADKTKLDALAPGDVTAVTGTAPIVSSGGATPAISISAATDVAAGSLSAADKTKLDTLASGTFTSVANAAALTARPITGFPDGAIAFVGVPGAATPSFCAYFALSPIGPLVADGVTILASSNAGFVWVRTLSACRQIATAQATWFVDPQNVSTTATDENNGIIAGTAVRTYAEIVRRWGTNAPLLNVQVIVQFLSSHTDDSDPVDVVATTRGALGGIFIRGSFGAGQQVAAGVLSNVTPKNRAANQPLLAQGPAGAVQNNLLVNATRANSRAWLCRVTAGAIHVTSEPFPPDTIPSQVLPGGVDTWANGDSVTAYAPINVNIVRFNPTIDTSLAGEVPAPSGLFQLNIWDPSGDGGLGTCLVSSQASITECSATRQVVAPTTSATNPVIATWGNNSFTEGALIEAMSTALFINGGILGSDVPAAGFCNTVLAGNLNVGNDTILSGVQVNGFAVVLAGSQLTGLEGTTLASAYIDKNIVVGVTGFSGYEAASAGDKIYGDATAVIDVTHTGRFTLAAAVTNGGIASCVPFAGTWKINGQTTAQAYSTTAGVGTWNGPRNLTTANLVATVGAGGFGLQASGSAINPGGACISGTL